MTGGVAGSGDDLQSEDLAAVGGRANVALERDLRDVGRAGPDGALRGQGGDVADAAGVVRMVVRQDDVANGVPTETGRLDGAPDPLGVARGEGIDHGDL